MAKKVLIVFAQGFEDVEAVTPVDLLRRAEVSVTVAGLGGTEITGSRGCLRIHCDTEIEKVTGDFDAIILPGGMPGASNLAASAKITTLIKELFTHGKIIAAICASPAVVLAPLGILEGKKATCYPSMEKDFPASTQHSSEPVVTDGNIITSKGPATAFSFSLAIIEQLCGKEKRDEIARATVAV